MKTKREVRCKDSVVRKLLLLLGSPRCVVKISVVEVKRREKKMLIASSQGRLKKFNAQVDALVKTCTQLDSWMVSYFLARETEVRFQT